MQVSNPARVTCFGPMAMSPMPPPVSTSKHSRSSCVMPGDGKNTGQQQSEEQKGQRNNGVGPDERGIDEIGLPLMSSNLISVIEVGTDESSPNQVDLPEVLPELIALFDVAA